MDTYNDRLEWVSRRRASSSEWERAETRLSRGKAFKFCRRFQLHLLVKKRGSMLTALCLPLLHKATLKLGSCAAAPLQGYRGAISKRGGCGYFTDIHRQLQLLCTAKKWRLLNALLGDLRATPVPPPPQTPPVADAKNTTPTFVSL